MWSRKKEEWMIVGCSGSETQLSLARRTLINFEFGRCCIRVSPPTTFYLVRSVLRCDEMTNRAVRSDREMQFAERPSSPLPDDLSLSLSLCLITSAAAFPEGPPPVAFSPHRLLPGTDLRGSLLFSGTVRVPDPESRRFVAADRCSSASAERAWERLKWTVFETSTKKMQPSPPGILQWRAHFNEILISY